MNPKLSRRVAKIANTPEMIQLSRKDREAFIKEVENAFHFGRLPKRWQKFIEQAERSLKQGFILKYGEKTKR